MHQFAYVTDGACAEDDILSMEIIIMKVYYHNLISVLCLSLPALLLVWCIGLLFTPFVVLQDLNWSLSPLTPVAWLNIYMQMAYLKETAEVLMAQYPQATFVQIAEVRRGN